MTKEMLIVKMEVLEGKINGILAKVFRNNEMTSEQKDKYSDMFMECKVRLIDVDEENDFLKIEDEYMRIVKEYENEKR